MSVSAKILHNKLQEFRPDLASSVTMQILNKVCDEPITQPFLNWFCNNINHANILSKEEVQIKERIENTKEWLEGEELEKALEEATRDCPELLELVTMDNAGVDHLVMEFKQLTDFHKDNESYMCLLKNNTADLRELELNLDEEINQEETLLEKENIKTIKAYNDCSIILEKYNACNREFSKDVDRLLKTYADAAENKGPQMMWTQIPIDLFIRQVKSYNDYLVLYIKKEFENLTKTTEEIDSDSASVNDSKGNEYSKQMQSLGRCKAKLINSMMEKIISKAQEASAAVMVEHAKNIYNNGNVEVPVQTDMQEEILKLTRRRDLLEMDVTFLQEQKLDEAVQRYAEAKIREVLESHVSFKLEQRRILLKKLEKLLLLTQDEGLAQVDLLYILIRMQIQSLKDIAEFIADARHYLKMEYSLSLERCESMQQEQEKYNAYFASFADSRNIFNQLFISMMRGHGIPDNDTLDSAIKKYKDVIAYNTERERMIYETVMDFRIGELLPLENEVKKNYEYEAYQGETEGFKPISSEISTQYEETSKEVEEIRSELAEIRVKLKDRKKNNLGLEREKEILWQRFLVDPETLKSNYEEAKQRASHSQFGSFS